MHPGGEGIGKFLIHKRWKARKENMEPAFDHIDSRKIARLVSEQKDPHRILLEEIGPAFAEYRRKWDLARTFRLKLPFPLHVDYEFSFTCNLR